MNDLKPYLAKIAGGASLSEADAEAAFNVLMSGAATPAQIGAFLMALRVRGETVSEITGAAKVMRAKALKVEAPVGAIDTCGTGGDGAGTFNISTAAALVAAACGVVVAKHGNRAMSSKSGTADVLAVELHDEGAKEIARRSRGTPRIANRLLRRVRDYAQVRADGVITLDVAREALKLLDVDDFGLDDMDGRILRTIIEKFEGGPVGVSTIAAAIGEDADTIEEVYEPFLVMNGFLQRTARGRVASALAYRHLGFTPPQRDQATLF